MAKTAADWWTPVRKRAHRQLLGIAALYLFLFPIGWMSAKENGLVSLTAFWEYPLETALASLPLLFFWRLPSLLEYLETFEQQTDATATGKR